MVSLALTIGVKSGVVCSLVCVRTVTMQIFAALVYVETNYVTFFDELYG